MNSFNDMKPDINLQDSFLSSPTNQSYTTESKGFSAISTPLPQFQRTRSLCYRKKKKNAIEEKSSTVPRRKLITARDDNSFDYYATHYNRPTNGLSPASSSFMREEHVEDITEKIITNINDHLERFEKNQNGELERDNKILSRDNATLKEKIRILEDILRENELKADNKLSELIATNRKYLSQLEQEKTEEIQKLKFRIQSLEKQSSDKECVQERLEFTVETLKKQNQELSREISVCNETNLDLREKGRQFEDKNLRLHKRLENKSVIKDVLRQDLITNLVNVKMQLNGLINQHHLDNDSTNTDDSFPKTKNQTVATTNKEINDDPDTLIFDIMQLIHRIKKDKDKIDFQKAEIMTNLMSASSIGPPKSMLEDDFLINFQDHASSDDTNMAAAALGDEIFNHHFNYNGIINDSDTTNGVDGGNIQTTGDASVNNSQFSRSHSEENPFPQDDDVSTKYFRKENSRLKRYIDRLLLIILETQPSLLEITDGSKSSSVENGD